MKLKGSLVPGRKQLRLVLKGHEKVFDEIFLLTFQDFLTKVLLNPKPRWNVRNEANSRVISIQVKITC